MSAVVASKVTVYRANGKGRGFRVKSAAYRSAAIQRVNAGCDKQHAESYHERHGETCRYCLRECEGRRGIKHFDDYEDGTCAADPSHSYRYRLVGRLARWLRWRDERAERAENTVSDAVPNPSPAADLPGHSARRNREKALKNKRPRGDSNT